MSAFLRRIALGFLIILLLELPSMAISSKLASFDLFGFQAGTMLKGRAVAAKVLQEEMAKRKIPLQAKSGYVYLILDVEGVKYSLALIDSETEGFSFTLSNLPSDLEYVKSQAKDIHVVKLLNKDFLPLSNALPVLQFGAAKPEEAVSVLGKADYVGLDENDEAKAGFTHELWFLKRDLKKEKDCFNAVAKKPPFEAIEVVLTFDIDKKLRRISFVNGISGEC